jgi:hypothetical protein
LFTDTLDITPIGAGIFLPGTAILTLDVDGYLAGSSTIYGQIQLSGASGFAMQSCNPSEADAGTSGPCQLAIQL